MLPALRGSGEMKPHAAPEMRLDLKTTPISRPKLYEIVAERLEQMILSEQLRPGDALPSERDLMVAFQIGRPAVREAFLALQNKGLIVTESGRRARVATPSLEKVVGTLNATVRVVLSDGQSLRNLYEARIFIERAMARNAALNMTDAELEALRLALKQNEAAIGNRQAFVDSDVAFHRILFLVPGNPVFESIYTVLMTWLMYRWSKIARNRRTETLAFEGHRAIVAAIAGRDPDAAEAKMEEHLNSSWTIWSRGGDS